MMPMLCKQPILEQERIVCLDTNVVLHQMDLVENLKFCNVVIFSTVLEEVQFAGAPYCTVLHRIAPYCMHQFCCCRAF